MSRTHESARQKYVDPDTARPPCEFSVVVVENFSGHNAHEDEAIALDDIGSRRRGAHMHADPQEA